MSNKLQTTKDQADVQTAPANALIAQAIEKGADIEVLERLFNLQERWEKNQAKKEYDEAMTAFQSESPIIPKAKEGSRTKSGQLAFKYAPLDLIVKIVKPILSKHKLSYDFKTVKNESGDVVAIRCYAKHVGGHSDYSEMELGQGGGTSIMSDEQIKASKITFAKRYAFCNIFGIVTEDEDNEQVLANKNVDTSYIDEIAQIKTLSELKKYHKDNEKKYHSLAYNEAILEQKEILSMPVIQQ